MGIKTELAEVPFLEMPFGGVSVQPLINYEEAGSIILKTENKNPNILSIPVLSLYEEGQTETEQCPWI